MLSLRFTKQAQKAMRKLPGNIATRLRTELDVIARNPSAYRGDWQPLQGSPFWRLRVGGWRAVCERRDDELVLLVLKIGPRGDVYK
jgi:mRNA interferase RelE/StbE